ncbi:MAG TPA: sigma-70 family RNA polymerase sigma factor [Acidobacteriota bacterium]|nr:sigma-70 family RNA polymerase sigma factor [Acidobacteriota bacterium]
MNGIDTQDLSTQKKSAIAAPSEIELLYKARQGDLLALEKIYIHYLRESGAIQALLSKAIPRDQREEMLHEIFVQLISGRHAFRGEAQLKTYVYQVARITIFQKFRKENTYKRGKLFRVISEPIELRDSGDASPESNYCLKQARQIACEMIEKLPQAYRDVLRLRVLRTLATRISPGKCGFLKYRIDEDSQGEEAFDGKFPSTKTSRLAPSILIATNIAFDNDQ